MAVAETLPKLIADTGQSLRLNRPLSLWLVRPHFGRSIVDTACIETARWVCGLCGRTAHTLGDEAALASKTVRSFPGTPVDTGVMIE